MDGIKKPKIKHVEMQYYDENEAQLAIEALYKEAHSLEIVLHRS
jgi:hypothetical protein